MYQTCSGNGVANGAKLACQTPTVDSQPSMQAQNSNLAFYSGGVGVMAGLGDATNAVYVPQFNCDGNKKNNSLSYVMSPFLCYAVGKLSNPDAAGTGINGVAVTPAGTQPATYFYPAFPNLLSVGATANGRYAYAVSALGTPNALLAPGLTYNVSGVNTTAVMTMFSNITANVNMTCLNATYTNATGWPTYGQCTNSTFNFWQNNVNATAVGAAFGAAGPGWYLTNMTQARTGGICRGHGETRMGASPVTLG